MYYVATQEFMQQWDDAKKNELVCRMEKAIVIIIFLTR